MKYAHAKRYDTQFANATTITVYNKNLVCCSRYLFCKMCLLNWTGLYRSPMYVVVTSHQQRSTYKLFVIRLA